MGSSVSEFTNGYLSKGLAVPNRYKVTFNSPAGADDVVDVFCHAVTLPSRAMMTFEHRSHVGPTYQAPYSGSYEAITCSFYADPDLNSRQFFDKWQQKVTNVESDTNNYWDEFVGTIIIETRDREDKPHYKVKIYDAYPININSVDLSYGERNNFVSISVSFAFKYWKEE